MEERPLDGRRKTWTLVAVLGATFMLLVDILIVQVALPRIQHDLHAGFSGLQWVIDAYTLPLSALILTFGSLSDRFGRKRVFVAGVVVFTIASLLCGVAMSSLFLDVARALQGVGGAAMFATSLALIAQEFQGRDRATAIALWGATVGGAVAIAPLLGGAITEGLGWEWVFFVNVPIGAAVLLLAVWKMVNVGDPGSTRVDVPGLVTFSAFLFLLVFGLVRGNAEGWSSPLIVGIFAGSVLLGALFIAVELRHPRPMFDLSLFRNPAFAGVQFGTFAIGAGMFALFPFLTLYFQNILGYSPLRGGVVLLPATVFVFVVPVLARNLPPRISQGVVLGTGLGLVGIGIVLMYGLRASSRWTDLLAGLIVTGIGIGLANPSIARIALSVVPRERAGMASGISNTFRVAGVATGVAALGALLQHRVEIRVRELLPGAPHAVATAVTSGGTRAAAAAAGAGHHLEAAHAARAAYVSGLNLLFVVSAPALFLGAALVFALVRGREVP